MKSRTHMLLRAALTEKILRLFHALQELPELGKTGIGKDGIKRTLLKQEGQSGMSINTVKRIVDELVEKEIVECVNPGQTSHLRFRLSEVKDNE